MEKLEALKSGATVAPVTEKKAPLDTAEQLMYASASPPPPEADPWISPLFSQESHDQPNGSFARSSNDLSNNTPAAAEPLMNH